MADQETPNLLMGVRFPPDLPIVSYFNCSLEISTCFKYFAIPIHRYWVTKHCQS